MSRLAFVLGLAISIGLHGLLLIDNRKSTKRPGITVRAAEPVTAKVAISTLPKPRHSKTIPEKIPKPKATPVNAPEQVVKPSSTKVATDSLGDMVENESTDSLPELRLVWESTDQLRHVSRALRFRILAVDSDYQPIGELSLADRIRMKPFHGNLQGYSNRVRTLPADFFGAEAARHASEPVKCLWILVPASIDVKWVYTQKRAITARGLSNNQVAYVEARIVPTGNGYDLEIVKIVRA